MSGTDELHVVDMLERVCCSTTVVTAASCIPFIAMNTWYVHDDQKPVWVVGTAQWQEQP